MRKKGCNVVSRRALLSPTICLTQTLGCLSLGHVLEEARETSTDQTLLKKRERLQLCSTTRAKPWMKNLSSKSECNSKRRLKKWRWSIRMKKASTSSKKSRFLTLQTFSDAWTLTRTAIFLARGSTYLILRGSCSEFSSKYSLRWRSWVSHSMRKNLSTQLAVSMMPCLSHKSACYSILRTMDSIVVAVANSQLRVTSIK